eukprot:1047864-Pelagomonas_calceolata.AAC.6
MGKRIHTCCQMLMYVGRHVCALPHKCSQISVVHATSEPGVANEGHTHTHTPSRTRPVGAPAQSHTRERSLGLSSGPPLGLAGLAQHRLHEN